MHQALIVLNRIYKEFEKGGWVFMVPLNPISLTCGLTAAEATRGKGKDSASNDLICPKTLSLL